MGKYREKWLKNLKNTEMKESSSRPSSLAWHHFLEFQTNVVNKIKLIRSLRDFIQTLMCVYENFISYGDHI